MTLSKKELLKLIEKEKSFLFYLNKTKEEMKNGKYKNESLETQKIHSCSTEISFIDHEAKLEVLNQILCDFYKPKKRQPTKLEWLTECLKYIEKRAKNNKTHCRCITQWKFFTINEFKDKIKKLKSIKENRKEVFERLKLTA